MASERTLKRKAREHKKIKLNAITWAAKEAHTTYGKFVQGLTKEDEARIYDEYAAYLEEMKKGAENNDIE